MKKIGITGTHGVGKTTLAFKLASKYKSQNPKLNINLLPDVARFCPFPINEITKIESQMWIYHKQMVMELEQSIRSDILICDRTILDNLAYTRNASLTRDVAFELIINNNIKQAIEWLKTYDQIYFLRPTHELMSDGVRSNNLKFREEIDLILLHWLEKYKIKVAKENE